jgi:hypothetical protein
MKKIFALIITAILAITGVAPASAATVTNGGYFYDAGSECYVYMTRDASYYTPSATSVDIKMSNNGKCNKTLYYDIETRSGPSYGYVKAFPSLSGYFNSSSPWKAIPIGGIPKLTSGPNHTMVRVRIGTSSYKKSSDNYYSQILTIQR